MGFKVEAWYGLHTSGTKFYQVIRFVSPNGTSFAIAHYGAKAVFTGMGKIGAGQCDLAEAVSTGTKAGTGKINQKKKDGYTSNEAKDIFTFAALADLNNWVKANLNDKSRKFYMAESKKADFNLVSSLDPDPALMPQEPDEPNHIKHTEWGTW